MEIRFIVLKIVENQLDMYSQDNLKIIRIFVWTSGME